MEELDLDKRYEMQIPNEIGLDADGNEVTTYRKESVTLRQLYQLKNSAQSSLAAIQSKINFIENQQKGE